MRTHLLGRSIALAVTMLLVTSAAAVAQEDYVILRSFGHLPPFAGGVSPLQKGRDGSLYTRHQSTWYRMALDGGLTPLGETPPIAIAIDGGDGFFYFTDGDLVLKFEEGGTPTIIYQIADHLHDGQMVGSVVLGADGHLYGLTRLNGTFGNGTLFRVTRDGVFTRLHSFTLAEGDPSSTQLTQGSDGFFYSTSDHGGIGHGVILRISASGNVTPLYTFAGTEGRIPRLGLREASDGWMYGVTMSSESLQPTVFKVRSDGMFQVVHTFVGAYEAGVWPTAVPVEASDGTFYGPSGSGIYQMTPAGSVRLLHNSAFASPIDAGGNRWGVGQNVVEGIDGNFYGTASDGGASGNGVLFRLNRQRVRCTNVVTPMWQDSEGGTLYLTGAVKSETPALFTTWLVTQYGAVPLWFNATPAIDPAFAYELPLPLASMGIVGVFTLVITSTFDVCADWKTENTGGPGPTAEELRRLFNAERLLGRVP